MRRPGSASRFNGSMINAGSTSAGSAASATGASAASVFGFTLAADTRSPRRPKIASLRAGLEACGIRGVEPGFAGSARATVAGAGAETEGGEAAVVGADAAALAIAGGAGGASGVEYRLTMQNHHGERNGSERSDGDDYTRKPRPGRGRRVEL